MMIQNDIRTKTYTSSNPFFFISPITSDSENSKSDNLWMDKTPSPTTSLVFWSPELIDEDALPPNAPIWDEIDTMLAKIWSDSKGIDLEEKQLYAEVAEIERLAEMKRFKTLYGEIDNWE